MGRSFWFLIGVVALAIFVVANAVFIVDERNQVVLLQLGEIREVYNESCELAQPDGSSSVDGANCGNEEGLKFKIPFIQSVRVYEKRILYLDLPETRMPAGPRSQATDEVNDNPLAFGEGELLTVDAFARWRIADPIQFLQAARTEETGRQRLTGLLLDAVRSVIAESPSEDVVSGQRAEIMERIRQRVEERVAGARLGVEIVDVRLKRVELPQGNQGRVFARMIAERREEAAGLLAAGRRDRTEIIAQADARVRGIRAEGEEESRRIRGQGDGDRYRILAGAYSGDEEFAEFYRTLLTYELLFRDGTPMVLSPESELFRFLDDDQPPDRP